jgi:catechol 2,3-dioxygenase-like lactoylglutathione lyase family enzyme
MKLDGLIPMLITPDLPRTIDFYTRELGFELEASWPAGGDLTWCRLKCGSAILMFMTPEEEMPEIKPALTGQLYLYPPDVDALWRELSGKVEVVSPLANWDHGMREFQIRDCNGYVLRFGAESAEGP